MTTEDDLCWDCGQELGMTMCCHVCDVAREKHPELMDRAEDLWKSEGWEPVTEENLDEVLRSLDPRKVRP